MKITYNEQRVGIFVDVQNMYYSAKQLFNMKVNFANILKNGVRGRKLIRAFAYVIKADIKEEGNFFGALDHQGYDVKTKDLQIFYGGAKKGDWDIGIAMDVMKMTSKLDVIVLVSGDGDFQELVEYCKALGCRVEVMAFGRTASSKLKTTADEFLDMEHDKKTYLIGEFKPSKSAPPAEQSSNGQTSITQIPVENPPNVDARSDATVNRGTGDRRPPMRSSAPMNRSMQNNRGRAPMRRPMRTGSPPPRGRTSVDRMDRMDRDPISSLQRINMEQPDRLANNNQIPKEIEAKPVVKVEEKTPPKEVKPKKSGLLSKLKQKLSDKKK